MRPLALALGALLCGPWLAAAAQVEQVTWDDPTLAQAARAADLIVVARVTHVGGPGAAYLVEKSLKGPDRAGDSLAVTGLHHPALHERAPVAVGDRAYLLLLGEPTGEGFTVPTPTFGRFPIEQLAEGREEVIGSMGGVETFVRLGLPPARFEALLRAALEGSDPALVRFARHTLAEDEPDPEAVYWALEGLALVVERAPAEARAEVAERARAVLDDPRHQDDALFRLRTSALRALARAGGRGALAALLERASSDPAPAVRSVAAQGVAYTLATVSAAPPRRAAVARLAELAPRASARPITFGAADDPRTNRLPSPLEACLVALARLGAAEAAPLALAALERDELDAIVAGLRCFEALGDPRHVGEVAARMRPPGPDAFVNARFAATLEQLTGERLGPRREAWLAWWRARGGGSGPPRPPEREDEAPR